MKVKPRLVDYSLFKKSKVPKIKVIQNSLLEPNKDNSLIINFIGILILCIGGLYLYNRLIERENIELKKQNTIIGFHQYVNEKII